MSSLEKPQYIPKSKRSPYRRWLQLLLCSLITTIQPAFSWMETSINQLKTKRRHRNNIQRMNGAIPLHHDSWYIPGRRPKFRDRQLICHHAVSYSTKVGQEFESQRPIIFDTDSEQVGIDNRASACMSHDIRDFVGQLTKTDRVVKGFAGSRTSNVKMGTIEWHIEDDTGMTTAHTIPNSYYVPDGKVRLLSPQHWMKSLPKHMRNHRQSPSERTYTDHITLHWNQDKSTKTIMLDPQTNVATFTLAPNYNKFQLFCQEAQVNDNDEYSDPTCVAHATEIVTDDEADAESDPETKMPQPRMYRFNLDGPKHAPTPVVKEDEEEHQTESASAEFLRYHHRFGHISPVRIQKMAKQGILPRRLATCPVPVCTACLYGKATRRKWRHKTTKNELGDIAPTQPGQVVSVDQMISPTLGMVVQDSGNATHARFRCATIFVDHASDLSFLHLQKSTTAEETLEAKVAFERYAKEHGVNVQHYHCDNGVFTAAAWRSHCQQEGQGLSFAGAYAHHQNGRAERRIRELQQSARTMLIHAHRRWPDAVNAHLWPYAMRMANDAINITPSLKRKDSKTPMSIFANTTVAINPNHWHHFGCPIYVLAKPLLRGTIHGKWKERASMGLYLGRSPRHAQSVALVLDLNTGYVTPQFHVKFDSSFQTVRHNIESQIPQSQWQRKMGFLPETKDTAPVNDKFAPATSSTSEGDQIPPVAPSEGASMAPPEGADSVNHIQHADQLPAAAANQEMGDANLELDAGDPNDQGIELEDNVPELVPTATITRSGRQTRPVQRLIEAMQSQVYNTLEQGIPGEIFALHSIFPEPSSEHPLLCYGATADPDTLYYHEAMKAPDKQKFMAAMEEEVNGQLNNRVYSPKLRALVPKGATILPAVWAMRRKRRSRTGEIYRYKSRLNIGGHKQKEGIDYDQTYAPVVTWPSIRLQLILTLVNKWHTRQIDYVQAYPQAPVDRAMYMEVPPGFDVSKAPGTNNKDYVLEIHRNIYGQRQAGRVWNKYLVQKLLSVGFKQSKHDECVFFHGRTMYVLYTDDSILSGPDSDEIDRVIALMRSSGLELTVDGTLEDFLGINIQARDDGSFLLTQTRLIESILKDLGLDKDDVAIKHTPSASSKILSRHLDSPAFDGHFHYRSVIGKMNYLEKCTRPDIAYAVHQCARFAADPRYQHGQAVKWLGRYLYGTKDQGIITKPSMERSLELYVDSDWSGNWDRELAATDSSTARSRHGYILHFCGCPIFWASQLQTEIALSSTEAEYIGLSKALRETIPMMNLLDEMKQLGFPIPTSKARVHCRVFEDNSGAVIMATEHKMRPRTKHINIKYHHFRSYVDSGKIVVQQIKSINNWSDMLTKAQPLELFRTHRKHVLGWDIGDEKGCSNNDKTATEGSSDTSAGVNAPKLNPTAFAQSSTDPTDVKRRIERNSNS